MNSIKKIIAPFASLRLTVVLLVLAMILVLAGTTAQRDLGIQDVQHQFFHAWLAKIDLHYFQPTPTVAPGHLPSEKYIPGAFYLPGGYSLIIAMLVNLLAAHTVRFKFRFKRTGIILIHSGLILLLVGEMITSFYAVESQMPILFGATANYSQDVRFVELAVIDPSSADKDHVTVIPQERLEKAIKTPIHDERLPFDVEIERWYDNSTIAGPMQWGSGIDHLADAGDFGKYGLIGKPKLSGAGDPSSVDRPGAFVKLTRNGAALGTYLLSVWFDGMGGQNVAVDGKTYNLALRFTRYYKPYTVTLTKFTHDVYPGTDTPKDFASTIRLVDPSRHVDREVRIWMNHPLRYNGETFYQQTVLQEPDKDGKTRDIGTVLQVVHNPVWIGPYIACAIGALGLVLHFGMTLVNFLIRRLAPAEGTVGAVAGGSKSSGKSASKGRDEPERYILKPEPRWATMGLPLLIAAIAAVCALVRIIPQPNAGKFDLNAFGQLPISFEGRVQPLDSVARNTLSIISGGHTVFEDAGKKEHPAIEWLIDVMTRSGNWRTDKVIRIDHPQIKDLLGLKEEEKLFSADQVFANEENGRKLEEQAHKAADEPENQRDTFQQQILELHNRLGSYIRFQQVSAILTQYDVRSNPEQRRALIAAATLAQTAPEKLTNEQSEMLENLTHQLSQLQHLGPADQLYIVAPLHSDEKWEPLSIVIDPKAGDAPRAAEAFLRIARDYTDGRAEDFNADVAAYQSLLKKLPDKQRVDLEYVFNRVSPFYFCMVAYVFVFLLAVFSWLGWSKPLRNTAFALISVAMVIHLAGVVLRIYISGRPPVTNLYSASVFIGLMIIIFSIGIESIYRNGVGLVAGSMAGFMSLLVAAGFALGEGDTMKQLQAVLDTNFWLATHVVCVSMGYMASVLAGVLAIVYVVRNIADKTITPEDAKDTSRMIYGVVCFAMLFSFVGTILGGIWADQSWGRFWGWDPKENGAVLVVLWNAMILHVRWSGLLKDRGVAVLAILGNIVVGWSFVGTNLLGIGLHAYGFMSGAQMLLIVWCLINIGAAVAGMMSPAPKRLSTRAANTPNTSVTFGRVEPMAVAAPATVGSSYWGEPESDAAVDRSRRKYPRGKKNKLWAIGLGVIAVSASISLLGGSSSGTTSPYEQGRQMGIGIVAVLGWLIGLMIIIVSVVSNIRAARNRH